MKKIYLLASFLLLWSLPSSAQTYFLSQYFDGSDTISSETIIISTDSSSTNIWQIGKPQKMIFDSAATASNALMTDTVLNYPVNNTSSFLVKVWNMYLDPIYPAESIELSWNQKLDMDQGLDGGIIETTLDNGVTWYNIEDYPTYFELIGFQSANFDTIHTGEYAFTGIDTTWRTIHLFIGYQPALAFDTILVRFTFKSDSIDNAREGWLIDNFDAGVTYYMSINENEKLHNIAIYPNPASDEAIVQVSEKLAICTIDQMDLIDVHGRIIESWKDIPTTYKIDTRKYENGMYFVRMQSKMYMETIPLMIEK